LFIFSEDIKFELVLTRTYFQP